MCTCNNQQLKQPILKILRTLIFFFQSALNFEQPQRILKFFFQTALNLGHDKSGLIFFSSKCVEIRYSLTRNEIFFQNALK
jgi:hypothetical protein